MAHVDLSAAPISSPPVERDYSRSRALRLHSSHNNSPILSEGFYAA